jgi:hypothetical protein
LFQIYVLYVAGDDCSIWEHGSFEHPCRYLIDSGAGNAVNIPKLDAKDRRALSTCRFFRYIKTYASSVIGHLCFYWCIACAHGNIPASVHIHIHVVGTNNNFLARACYEMRTQVHARSLQLPTQKIETNTDIGVFLRYILKEVRDPQRVIK